MNNDNFTVLAILSALVIYGLVQAIGAGLLRQTWSMLVRAYGAAQDAFTTVLKVNDTAISFTATGQTKYTDATYVNGKRSVVFLCKVSALAGTGTPTITITQQYTLDNGVTWADGDAFTAITADGTYRKDPTSQVVPRIRFKIVSSGTTVTAGDVWMYLAFIDPSHFINRST